MCLIYFGQKAGLILTSLSVYHIMSNRFLLFLYDFYIGILVNIEWNTLGYYFQASDFNSIHVNLNFIYLSLFIGGMTFYMKKYSQF